MIGVLAVAALAGAILAPSHPGWITLPNGVTLRYEERGDAAADPVILLHGYTDSRQSFERLTALLPERVHTIAIDLRGHGDSDRPGNYDITAMADDVVRFLEARRLNRVTVVGHSMGSLVAREVARQASRRVAKLVLIGSAPTFDNDVVRQLQTELSALGNSIDVGFVTAFQRSTIHEPVPRAFFERVIAASSGVPPRVWHQTLEAIIDYDDRRRLGSIRVPTLLLWGVHDAIVGPEDQEALLDGIPGSYLVFYGDLGHAPHWERPDAVVADLLAFLESEPDRR